MKIFCLLFLLVALGGILPHSSLFASVTGTGIVKVYEVGKGDPMHFADGRRYVLRISLYICNEGSETIRIPTAGFRRFSEESDSIVSHLVWELSKTQDGKPIIPAESSLNLVVLRKGEVALIQWDEVTFAPLNTRTVSVQVSADADFVRRLNIYDLSIDIKSLKVIKN